MLAPPCNKWDGVTVCVNEAVMGEAKKRDIILQKMRIRSAGPRVQSTSSNSPRVQSSSNSSSNGSSNTLPAANNLSSDALAALRSAAALEDTPPLPDLIFEGAPDYIDGFALEAVYLEHVPHEQRAVYLEQRRDDEQSWRAMKETIVTMQDDLQQLKRAEQSHPSRAPPPAALAGDGGPPKPQLGWLESLSASERPPLE